MVAGQSNTDLQQKRAHESASGNGVSASARSQLEGKSDGGCWSIEYRPATKACTRVSEWERRVGKRALTVWKHRVMVVAGQSSTQLQRKRAHEQVSENCLPTSAHSLLEPQSDGSCLTMEYRTAEQARV